MNSSHHPAAVAAAEKICEFFSPCKTARKYDARDITPIISDAITAALSAPSPVGKTPTPRTDEATHHLCGDGEVLSMQPYDHGDWVPAEFARQLERELAAAKKQADECWGAANYRLKYIAHLFRAIGLTEDNMESRISEAADAITALREQVRALEKERLTDFALRCMGAEMFRKFYPDKAPYGSKFSQEKIEQFLFAAFESAVADPRNMQVSAARPASGGEAAK